jgi:hypothetical protein
MFSYRATVISLIKLIGLKSVISYHLNQDYESGNMVGRNVSFLLYR